MDVFVKKMKGDEPLYSFHAFIFPFEWSVKDSAQLSFEKQANLEVVNKLMAGSTVWERSVLPQIPESLVAFNERVYFYDFVRPVLYDTAIETSLLHEYHSKKVTEGLEYVIRLNDGRAYHLEVQDMVLCYYNMGVGFLAFHLQNKRIEQSSPEDVLLINTLGRRLYPPFFMTDTSVIGQREFFDYADWKEGLNKVKKINQLAAEIRIEKGGELWVNDDFSDWCCKPLPERTPVLIGKLLPTDVRVHLSLKPVLDDRMFTLCWYGNESLIKDVQGNDFDKDFLSHDWWYRYVFVDGSSRTCESARMMRALLEKATNNRWGKSGTYYGVSRYSFVALTDSISKNSFAALICSHIQTIYYKIALLGLMQRASMLRFSEEVSSIGKLKAGEKEMFDKVESLYNRYIHFINRVYFREVTAQEQGIELYNALQQQMCLPTQVKELEREIEELHRYSQILDENLRNEKLDILTYIAALFVVPSFIGTYFGIADFDMKSHWVGISIVVVLSAAFALGFLKSKRRICRIWWLVALAMLVIFSLFFYPNWAF